MSDLRIVSLKHIQDMPPVVSLQRGYWGDDGEAVIPSHMLYSIVANGGHVLAAMDGQQMAGFVVGMLGYDAEPMRDNLYIYSKRMVVGPNYRNQGLAYRLKMAQRDEAIRLGLSRVIWTFDPMLTPNAHLNLRKLGGMSRHYLTDHYGTDNTGGLSPFGMSDRLYLEWFINDADVVARVHNTFSPLSYANYLQQGAEHIGWDDSLLFDAETILLQVTPRGDELLEVMLSLRDKMQTLMRNGYSVVDFVQHHIDEQRYGFYVLRRISSDAA